MKTVILISAIVLLFCWLIIRQYRSKRLPPNAQLLCDLWNSIADDMVRKK